MITTDHKTVTHPRARPGPARDDVGMPVLLLTAFVALVATVAAIWGLIASSAMWAVAGAMVVAVGGAVALVGVIYDQLADSEGTIFVEVRSR